MKFKKYDVNYIYRLKNKVVKIQYVKDFQIHSVFLNLTKVEDFYKLRNIILDHYAKIKILERI